MLSLFFKNVFLKFFVRYFLLHISFYFQRKIYTTRSKISRNLAFNKVKKFTSNLMISENSFCEYITFWLQNKKNLCKIYFSWLNINNSIFNNDFLNIMRFFHIFQVYSIRKYFKILPLYIICIKYLFFIKFYIELPYYKLSKAIKSHFLLIFSSCHNLNVIIGILACGHTLSNCL